MRIDVTTHTYRAHMHMCMWIYTRRALLFNPNHIPHSSLSNHIDLGWLPGVSYVWAI